MDPYGYKVGEGIYLGSGDAVAYTEVTKPDPSAAAFAAAQSPVIAGLTDSNTFFDMESDSFFDMDSFFSDSDQQQGTEQSKEAKVTDEHGPNRLADSVVSSIHCRGHRFGDAEAVVSSQQVSAHSFNHRKDELDCFRNQARMMQR